MCLNVKLSKLFQYVVEAQVDGKIENILCKAGDSVRKGEILVKMIPKI